MAELGLEFVCFHILVPSVSDSSIVLLLKVGNTSLPSLYPFFLPLILCLAGLAAPSGEMGGKVASIPLTLPPTHG